MNKIFNIIIAGVGGQGLITALQLIAQATLSRGYDVKTSELHGLSQRGGSVSVHIGFGDKVFSPLVSQAKADLIVALESQEALNVVEFASKKTIFLINQYQTPTLTKTISESQVKNNLKSITQKALFIPASSLCEKELSSSVVAGIFLLGYAVEKKLIPLRASELKKSIKEVMPEKYRELNLKALELAKNYATKT